METIESIKQKLIGKWRYDDGRIIEFKEDGECELTPRGGEGSKLEGKFVFSLQNNSTITFSTPFLEAICLFGSIDSEKFIYFDLQQDGRKIQRTLTKIN